MADDNVFKMSTIPELDQQKIPRHIAVIMDGNGRWAQNRSLPRIMGHREGAVSVHEIVRACREIGVKVLTLYAFSTENWNRPKLEVQALMSLLKKYLREELPNLKKNGISLRAIGEKDLLPDEVASVLDDVITQTSGNTDMIMNLALSYGSRNEITRAVKQITESVLKEELSVRDITEEEINSRLDTADQPPPDLLVRTGGEKRLSNFLLWQASYAELYFTDIYWPEFRKKQLTEAIAEFQLRQRRFGKTGEQVEHE